ncbi:MAG: hypothetical protein EBY24_07590 [Betaproteobacteria bacterium]|nr:hypothetical protein [Betaproteobacteria bacterium]
MSGVRDIERRIAAVEGAAAGHTPSALILLGSAGRDLQSMIGIDHVDFPRQEGERLKAFISRVEEHLNATRGLYSPMVTFARHATPTTNPVRGPCRAMMKRVPTRSAAAGHLLPHGAGFDGPREIGQTTLR